MIFINFNFIGVVIAILLPSILLNMAIIKIKSKKIEEEKNRERTRNSEWRQQLKKLERIYILEEYRKELRMESRDCLGVADRIDEPHIVYYVKVDNGSLGCLYKIGITKHDVQTRFSCSERDMMTVIKEWSFDSRIQARIYESGVLKKFSNYKYTGPNVLDSGNTELFTHDVMGLDVAA